MKLVIVFTILVVFYTNCARPFDVLSESTENMRSSKSFTSLDQAAGAITTLIPQTGPISPLIHFGDGKIQNGAHTTFPGLPSVLGYQDSRWQLDQTPGRDLMTPWNLQKDSGSDKLLGPANWFFPTADQQSHLKIYNHSRFGMVYELLSKNGAVNRYGGTGLILAPKGTQKQAVNGRIQLDLDFRISKLNSSNPNPANKSFHWFALSGLYFHVRNPATGQDTALLLQILHANFEKTNENNMYRANNGVDATMLGGILNSDLHQLYYSEMDDFRHISLNVNKYMCHAIKQSYGDTQGGKFNLPAYYRDPRNWSFTGYFFDLEHASGKCLEDNLVYGDACKNIQNYGANLEIGVQVANINLVQQQVENFKDVCQEFEEPIPVVKVFLDNDVNTIRTISAGQSVNLRYESTGATTCTLTAYRDNQLWYQNTNFSVSHSWGQTKFDGAGTYKWQVDCQNAQGKTSSAASILTVQKNASNPPPPVTTNSPSARIYLAGVLNNRATVQVGEAFDLRYESTNAQSCDLTAYTDGKVWYQNLRFKTSHDWGKVDFGHAGNFTWTIECRNSQGAVAKATASAQVVEAPSVNAQFMIDNVVGASKTIKVGQSIDLRYVSQNAKSCDLTAYINGKLWYRNTAFTTSHDWGRLVISHADDYRWEILCKSANGKTSSSAVSLKVVK